MRAYLVFLEVRSVSVEIRSFGLFDIASGYGLSFSQPVLPVLMPGRFSSGIFRNFKYFGYTVLILLILQGFAETSSVLCINAKPVNGP